MKDAIEMYALLKNTSNEAYLKGEQTSNRIKELNGRIEVFEQLIAEAELFGDDVLYFKESTGNLNFFMLDKKEIDDWRKRKEELNVAYA